MMKTKQKLNHKQNNNKMEQNKHTKQINAKQSEQIIKNIIKTQTNNNKQKAPTKNSKQNKIETRQCNITHKNT